MKLKKTFIKNTNWALAGLLTMLGFNVSCDDERVEYGTPKATYQIKGKVKSEQGEAIKGIQVLIENIEEVYYIRRDSTLTKEDGSFDLNMGDFPDKTNTYRVISSDIDGSENGGSFESDTTMVTFNSSELRGGKGAWNWGSATKEIRITLKKKTNE